MSEKLNEIRGKIDSLDNKIHDLLMQRAELIRDVSVEKQKSGAPIVHPAREAMMIRRLLDRHTGILPQAAIVGIWRELVGAVSMLQRGLQVYVSAQQDEEFCWDMAKDYFGSVLPMTRVASPLAAIAHVRENRDAIAVLPWPEDETQRPWWSALAHQEADSHSASRVRIVAALPHGAPVPITECYKKALVIGRIDYLPSGHDNSFVAIDVPQPLSRAKIIDIFKAQKIETLSIFTQVDAALNITSHLVEIACYLDKEDAILQVINEVLEPVKGRCIRLGGYPVPPIFRAGDTNPVDVKGLM